jgi:2'-5' RNA ligase
MRPALKLIPAEQMHVTLMFLGETRQTQVASLGELVREVGEATETPRLEMQGIGAFPNGVRPSVVWAGFARPSPLIPLADLLQSRCEELGFRRETRPFQPHLTLARVKANPPRELAEFLFKYAVTDFGAPYCSSLILYQSELRDDGSQYTPLVAAAFRPSSHVGLP